MLEEIIIKAVTTEDLSYLQEVGRKTFAETFAAENTELNMRNYLEKRFSIEQLTTEINDPNSSFYFAIKNEIIIGYLKINVGNAQTELKDINALEIERIYVLKKYQGKHVGQLLYEKAIQLAKDRDSAYVWLGVWEKNTGAINFYKKNGFIEFDKHIFRLGNDEQMDIMMKKSIK